MEEIDKQKIEMILSAKFEYFKRLNAEDKQKFLLRTGSFLKSKEFIPRDELNISDVMDDVRTLISAAAIQVTFGLEAYELPHFTKIFIYPREYYNRMTHHWHKGEANVLGALVFSWKDFKEGFADEHDKLNLGLHEMAHALMLTTKIDEGRDDFFVTYFDKWWAVSDAEFIKLEKHEKSFFRAYGGTDPQEFFAVCVEHFFEASEEFKEKHPEIYKHTCILLNQDPTNDYTKITEAREPLLAKLTNVTPQNLIYRTRGRTLSNLLGSLTLPGLYVGGFIIMSGSISSPQYIPAVIVGIMVITYFLYRYLRYKEFYVYDNAFAVGYERHGEDVDKQDVIGAPLCVSITFKTVYRPKGADANIIQVMHIADGELTKTEMSYNHIKSEQVQELKEAVKNYCTKNCIGYHDIS